MQVVRNAYLKSDIYKIRYSRPLDDRSLYEFITTKTYSTDCRESYRSNLNHFCHCALGVASRQVLIGFDNFLEVIKDALPAFFFCFSRVFRAGIKCLCYEDTISSLREKDSDLPSIC